MSFATGRNILVISLFIILYQTAHSQVMIFSRKDSLRGALRPERSYDVTHYDLHVAVQPEKKAFPDTISSVTAALALVLRCRLIYSTT